MAGRWRSLIAFVLREIWWVDITEEKEGIDMTFLKKGNIVGNGYLGRSNWSNQQCRPNIRRIRKYEQNNISYGREIWDTECMNDIIIRNQKGTNEKWWTKK